MMSQALGASVLQQGLQAYLKKHQYGNVVASDLFSSLTEASFNHPSYYYQERRKKRRYLRRIRIAFSE